MQLCAPAFLYLVFSVIVIIMAFVSKMKLESILLKAIFVALWTWLLNLICMKGYSIISWILVFLPLIITFGTIALIVELAHIKKA